MPAEPVTAHVEVVDAAATTELRRSLLRPSWPVGSVMPGDDESGALHFGAYRGAELVGAAVVMLAAHPARAEQGGSDWKLRGMGTAAVVRGRGVGSALIDAVVSAIVARDGRLLWCNARTTALGFYERNGFVLDGPEFVLQPSGIPHHVMSRAVVR